MADVKLRPHNFPNQRDWPAANDFFGVDSATLGTAGMPATALHNLATNFAPQFTIIDNYAVGDLVTHLGALYRFKVPHAAGAWNQAHMYKEDLDGLLNEVLSKATNYDYAQQSFTADSGLLVRVPIYMTIEPGDTFLVMVVGDSVVDSNGFNCQTRFSTNSNEVTEHLGYVRSYNTWVELTASTAANVIELNRSSANANGTITFKVLPKRYLYNLITELTDATSNTISELRTDIDALSDVVNGCDHNYTYDLSTAAIGYYYDDSGTLVSNSSSAYKDITFDSAAAGKNISITVSDQITTTDTRYFLLYDGNNTLKWSARNSTAAVAPDRTITIPYAVEVGWVLKASFRTGVPAPNITYVQAHVDSLKESIECYTQYVATSGIDSNDGSLARPKRTISAAVEAGAETIIVAGGTYDDDSIDLSSAKHDCITIKGKQGEKVLFKKRSSKLLADGSETLVSGYTKVFSAHTDDPGYGSSATQWLFFDDLADTSTAITPADEHPLERGQFYRNDCTKSVKTTATVLSSALAEIENSATFKWFYDSDTGVLYFNRPADSNTSIYPIYRSTGNYLITRRNQSIVMNNIEFRYASVNLKRLNIVNLYNVSAKYVYSGGAFCYDDSVTVIFDHCEAAACFMGTNGDGFNGHVNTHTGLTYKYCQVTLRECWSHDNRDDGYSDHEFAETTVDGGLFEYNNKAGVTPSYGSHCVCKNVMSRYNINGFYYTGAVNDNGNGGQMMCYNCVSIGHNARGGSGFRVDGYHNRAILVGCKSIDDKYAVNCAEDNYMDVVECTYSDVGTEVKHGDGTIYVQTFNPIT